MRLQPILNPKHRLDMTKKKIYHWITTSFVACVFGISGVLAATHAPPMMKALAHLGYPAYFADLLGLAKLAGVLVLLLPRLPRIKEWAYVGCAITILSASYSHLSSGDGLVAFEPLITFAALVISYTTRPGDRRLNWVRSAAQESSPGTRCSEATASSAHA
jgi:uncharacterized membrane protein YphA (DoxX/SURF4 family)